VEDAVHKQQEHGSQYRHDHPGSRAVAVWSDEPAKEGGDLPRLFQPVIAEDFSTSANSFGVR